MPKTKGLSQELTARKNFSDQLRAGAYVTYRGMPGLAAAVGVSESTIRKRISDPRGFDVNELKRVRKALGMSKDDVLAFLSEVI